MSHDSIEIGFQVFLKDGTEEVGAVRDFLAARSELVIYVENHGEFLVPLSAVHAVHSQKVIFDPARLEKKLLKAIGHAHDAETE